MRRLRFYKISPGGNATILILDPVAPEDRAPLARLLLDTNHIHAEQVGYLNLEARPVRLDMMGGEFCGNACRAAAAVMHREGRGLIAEEGECRGLLSVSGVERPLAVRVLPGGSELDCRVEMPMPANDAVTGVAPGIGLVRLPGIAHLCLDEVAHPFPADHGLVAAELRRRFGLTNEEAVGCIWHREERGGQAIRPVVWVRSTDSTCFETGCGSGSLALALWLGGRQNFPTVLRVLQPSGAEIGVCWSPGEAAWIIGPVNVIARGETWA